MMCPAFTIALALLFFGTVGRAQSDALDDEPELASDQVKQEALLEAKYAELKFAYGVGDPRTLEVFFRLFDFWIMLYRLNKADAALEEVVPACEWRRDDFTVKAIQALAFTRWKQGRYKDALARFHEMQAVVGKNAKLCENMGHTYNAMGAVEEAEASFKDALHLTSQTESDNAQVGGIWLGLAGAQERRGNNTRALDSAMRSYDIFKKRDEQRGWETSLTAKAAMSVSGLELKLGNLTHAEERAREAIRLFEKTAGGESPLVASALHRLGNILVKQGRGVEARSVLHRAYRLEGTKDSLDLVAVLEIHTLLVGTYVSSDSLDRSRFKNYFTTVDLVVQRVKQSVVQDGNAGAYYKAAGEMRVLGGDCHVGRRLLVEASALFQGETSVDTSGLVRQCQDLIDFCDGRYSPGSAKVDGEPGQRIEL